MGVYKSARRTPHPPQASLYKAFSSKKRIPHTSLLLEKRIPPHTSLLLEEKVALEATDEVSIHVKVNTSSTAGISLQSLLLEEKVALKAADEV